jgi:hypothetical protein
MHQLMPIALATGFIGIHEMGEDCQPLYFAAPRLVSLDASAN